MAGAATDARAALDRGFADHLRGLAAISAKPPRGDGLRGVLPRDEARAIFEAQLASRHLDFAARDLRARGAGFYTIGSAGHEGNAAVAAAARPTDPALLHYRSGAFFVRRAAQAGRREAAIRDVLLGMTAAADESIAGGRHKVFGSAELAIPPQTSTIASHLPKAVGMAFALDRGRRLGVDREAPDDAIVICSFGDASANHSTAAGAINAACRIAVHLPVPVLFVCEDNGLGISVRTPPDWIANAYGNRFGLRYLAADGCDPAAAYGAAHAAVDHVRIARKPAFLHLSVVRFMGHAGSDVELVYRSPSEIEAELSRDPLLRSAELLIRSGFATSEELIDRYEQVRGEVAALADEAAAARRLSSADEVMAPLAPRRPELVADAASAACDAATRAAFWGDRPPEAAERGLTLAGRINATLGDLLAQHPELLLFGEDVGRKGGVYGVTRGLDRRAGMARVFDTILDEQTILGLAIGAGQAGFLPVPEIQYLAYLHNAIDQLRGEAATLSFFSRARYRNPMVIRIAGYAYQKGFGGHFHNDNAIAPLRDIPGLVIASPSRGDDAAAMLRTCVAAAAVDGTVSVFLEPIALYNERDLHQPGDDLWLTPHDPAPPHVPIGAARVHGDGTDLLIVSFANGLRMSLRAARRAAADHGIRCRVLDLRWLAPLPVDDLLREAELTGRVVIADETRRSGGVSEAVIAALIDRGFTGPIRRVTSLDSFVPLGPAADHVLLTEDAILGTVITS